jgi:hypothetical protein
MMSCRIGDVEREEVEGVLAVMGWCPDHPDHSEYFTAKKAEVLARLPDPVRAEIASLDPVLITTFPNVWGLASFDRRHVLMLCLLGDDLEVVKQQCALVAVSLPRTFHRVTGGRRCDVDPHVEVRRFDGNSLITRGVVSDTGHVSFRRYVWAVRRRERVTLIVLVALCVVVTGVAVLLYAGSPGEDWTYLRGYLDRLSSAVQIAALITLVNLVFEYRAWKSAAAVIEWSLPVL